MFGSIGAGRGRNDGSSSSGGGGGVPPQPSLIPYLFTWPHGGATRVLICGSFTGSSSLPMSRIEGCPTGFQVICKLTPGVHHYKFCVDGVWRHNEQEAFINTRFGTVNTIFVPQPCIFNGMPGRSYMQQLYNNVTGHMGGFPSTPEFDLYVSRYHISKFMSSNTAYDMLPVFGKVIALDINLSLTQAFQNLYEQGVSMAPVWDSSKCKFIGVLSAMDIIQTLKELSHGSTLSDEQFERHTIAAWRDKKLQQSRTDSNGRTYPWSFVDASPFESLEDIALKILQYKVPAVSIMHSSSGDGSFPQLLHMTSLSEILRCICSHFKNDNDSLPVLKQPIGSLPLGRWVPKVGEFNKPPIATVRPNTSLCGALSLMTQVEVSSIPIVDDHASLLDVYSISDLTGLAKNEMYARMSLDEFSISQTLLFSRQNGKSPYGLILPSCLKSDPLHLVMERFADSGVGELVVVKRGSRRVQGIISLIDIFRYLLGL